MSYEIIRDRQCSCGNRFQVRGQERGGCVHTTSPVDILKAQRGGGCFRKWGE
jgi:hypothetical protein